jgi:hypothetical protein
MSKILIRFLMAVLLINLLSCSNIKEMVCPEENNLQNKNTDLISRYDSLSNKYNLLNEAYKNIKMKKPDTVFVYNPVDSINWIDSVRYNIKDSLVLIPHDTTVINFRDSTILIPHDTLIIHAKDTLVYNYKDSTLINYKDSTIIKYDMRAFPEKEFIKYLNLFFKADNAEDTTGLRYNISIFDGRKPSYIMNKNYDVPDSSTGWRIEWYHEE